MLAVSCIRQPPFFRIALSIALQNNVYWKQISAYIINRTWVQNNNRHFFVSTRIFMFLLWMMMPPSTIHHGGSLATLLMLIFYTLQNHPVQLNREKNVFLSYLEYFADDFIILDVRRNRNNNRFCRNWHSFIRKHFPLTKWSPITMPTK